MQHILSADQFKDQESIMSLVREAEEIRENGPRQRFPDKTVVHLFYEPSTRTSCSFQAAAHRMGCNVISLNDKASSAEKGESLEDTIRTVACYGDAIVLRHPDKGSAFKAASVSRVPVLNAGDGNGEHPTQALLDIYTIHRELRVDLQSSDRDYLNITFVGDLKNSRTVHSLILMLSQFPKMNFVCISPPSLELPDDIVNCVQMRQNRECVSMNAMRLRDAICFYSDVLYMTRIQKERFESVEEYDATMARIDRYTLTPELMTLAKPKMIVMHPLPRLQEISVEVDVDPRAAYFRQVENGLYMRMAILQRCFLQ
jgi:aspartate carbamoyltransferase